jgi:hypothetical protein
MPCSQERAHGIFAHTSPGWQGSNPMRAEEAGARSRPPSDGCRGAGNRQKEAAPALSEKLLDAGNPVLYGSNESPLSRTPTRSSNKGGHMYPARMSEWRAVNLSGCVPCVLAGALGGLVAAGSFPWRDTLSLTSSVATPPASGMVTAQLDLRVSGHLLPLPSRSSPDLHLTVKASRDSLRAISPEMNGADPQGARWTLVASAIPGRGACLRVAYRPCPLRGTGMAFALLS